MTPAEIKAWIASKLIAKKRAALTRQDFVTAWNAMTDARKDQIIQAAISGNSADAGLGLERMLNDYAKVLADLRADEMAADGSLNSAEISEILD